MKRLGYRFFMSCVTTAIVGGGVVFAQSPGQGTPKLPLAPTGLFKPAVGQKPAPVENLPKAPTGDIQLVQREEEGGAATQPQVPAAAPAAAPAPAPAPAAAPAAPVQAAAGGSSSTVNVNSAPEPGQSAVTQAGGQQPAQSLNAPDLGGLLSKSDQATGVEVQRRNAIISDPRVRGLRNGQYYALGDGVPYFPGRLDLDTPVSKFYPAMVRDVQVIRGPFTSLLGPGLAFINIGTLDSPRAKEGRGTEYHGVTALGYQTNGEQYNGLQVVTAAGSNWGFRGSYNVLQGNDYADGGGNKIPGSYQSNNFNVALGYDLTDDLSVEFKALRAFQNNLEFPGLYFDIDGSDTEAYNFRLTAKNFGPFDRLTTDLWYNATTSTGNTTAGSKQAFVNRLIKFAFEEPTIRRFPNGNIDPTSLQGYEFQDFSTTRFAERSIGYRLTGQWGNGKDAPTIYVGSDLNVFGQGLVENIRFEQLRNRTTGAFFGPPISTRDNPSPGTTPPGVRNFITQTQTIPESNSFNPGLFIEGMLPIGETLKLKSGGRLDYTRTSSNTRVITGNVDIFGQQGLGVIPDPNRFVLDPSIYSVDPAPFQISPFQRQLDRDFALYSGFATAEYKVTPETTLFVGYGHAERAPTLSELYSSGPFVGVLQQGTSRLLGDPNLSKERLDQFDVGLRYDTEYLKFGISGFYSFIHDYITYDVNRLSTLGLSQVVFTNTDLATLAGTELFLQAKATRWLSPFATLSYVQGIDQTHVDNRRGTVFSVNQNGTVLTSRLNSSRRKDPTTGEFTTDTEPLPQIPPMETRLGFRIHGVEDAPKWQIEFSTRIINGQNAVAASLGEQRTSGFTTFDLRGFVQVNKNFLITGGVENIGDKLYREHLDPIAANLLQGGTRSLGQSVPLVFRPGTNFFLNTQYTY